MLTCKSPRKVMRVAHLWASQSLPQHTCKFSRRDFTLPQLFACLAVKELLKRSYRGAEAVLRDSEHWCRDIGLRRGAGPQTLQPGAPVLLRGPPPGEAPGQGARGGGGSPRLRLSTDPPGAGRTA